VLQLTLVIVVPAVKILGKTTHALLTNANPAAQLLQVGVYEVEEALAYVVQLVILPAIQEVDPELGINPEVQVVQYEPAVDSKV
jgi:hypothetical protein